MIGRRDLGFRLALWLCRLLGHRWTPWTSEGDERCARCLRWRSGVPPGFLRGPDGVLIDTRTPDET